MSIKSHAILQYVKLLILVFPSLLTGRAGEEGNNVVWDLAQSIGPFYSEGSVTGDSHLDMFDKTIPDMHSVGRGDPILRKNWVLPLYALKVCNFLNGHLQER